MGSTVKLKRGQLSYFRKLARESNFEILAYLIGEVVSPSLTVIDSFEYTDRYAKQSENCVAWYVAEFDRVKEKAESLGRRIIGFIHSHPQWDAVMSEDDHVICISEGFRVCGIVSVHGSKTRARFWATDAAIPFKQVYMK